MFRDASLPGRHPVDVGRARLAALPAAARGRRLHAASTPRAPRQVATPLRHHVVPVPARRRPAPQTSQLARRAGRQRVEPVGVGLGVAAGDPGGVGGVDGAVAGPQLGAVETPRRATDDADRVANGETETDGAAARAARSRADDRNHRAASVAAHVGRAPPPSGRKRNHHRAAAAQRLRRFTNSLISFVNVFCDRFLGKLYLAVLLMVAVFLRRNVCSWIASFSLVIEYWFWL